MALKVIRNIFIGLLVGILFVTSFHFHLNQVEAQEEVEENFPDVRLLSPSQLEKNTFTFESYGTVDLVKDEQLYFQMSGVVDRVYIEVGQWVNEGDLIATLENDALTAQLAQAEASYDAAYNSYQSAEDGAGVHEIYVAEATLDIAKIQLKALRDAEATDTEIRIQELVVEQYRNQLAAMRSGLSDEDLRAYWAQVDMAEAGIEAARAAYRMSALYAPFSGEVVTWTLDEKDFVNASQSVGTLLNRDEVEITSYLSSSEADLITVGGQVFIDGYGEGEVIGISSEINDQTQKRKVRVLLPYLGHLIPGDTLELAFEKDLDDSVTLVPLKSILEDGGEHFVFYYRDGMVYKQSVEVGALSGSMMEVYDLPFLYIVEDISNVRDGSRVDLIL